MFRNGDTVCLNDLGKSESGLGNEEYIPNDCSQKLLDGQSLEVHSILPSVEGSQTYSIRFYDGGYSFSPNYFQLVNGG